MTDIEQAGSIGVEPATTSGHQSAALRPRQPVRARLRNATREVHERLHRYPPFVDITQGRSDAAEYRSLLMRLYGFHVPLERHLRAAVRVGRSCGIDLHRHVRAPLLEADLLHLGLDQPSLRRIPYCTSLPGLSSAGRLLGCLYVLEGSRLGGRELARCLDPVLGPGKLGGRRFLSGCSEMPDGLWSRCCTAIERHGGSDDARVAEMEAAACETFACFENWLTGNTR